VRLCSYRHRQKRLALDASLYTMLQLLSLTAFDKMPVDQLLNGAGPPNKNPDADKQLILFTD
jgi:hypothetical protein